LAYCVQITETKWYAAVTNQFAGQQFNMCHSVKLEYSKVDLINFKNKKFAKKFASKKLQFWMDHNYARLLFGPVRRRLNDGAH